MSLQEFLDITPGEFVKALTHNGEIEKLKIDGIIRPICEVLRKQTWWLYNQQVTKKSNRVKEEYFMAFPWDEEKKNQTEDQMRKVIRAIGIGTKAKYLKPRNHGD